MRNGSKGIEISLKSLYKHLPEIPFHPHLRTNPLTQTCLLPTSEALRGTRGEQGRAETALPLVCLILRRVMIPIGFKFGFCKRLHVVKTRREDREETEIDLTSYIAQVNKVKDRFDILKEEAPTQMIASRNPNILILWRGSA